MMNKERLVKYVQPVCFSVVICDGNFNYDVFPVMVNTGPVHVQYTCRYKIQKV